MVSQPVLQRPPTRVRVFIDYWNFQLTLNEREKTVTGLADPRFPVDWKGFPDWVADQAASVAKIGAYSYDGAIIYTSFDPRRDVSYKNWVTNWLDRQPGIQVDIRERQPKGLPHCPACHSVIADCPHCSTPIRATVEKGVDTAIVTDMIRLAWEDAYDLGVLVSSDSDLVPAVEYLDQKGRKIIQAGFPPLGVHLATACWASFDLFPLRGQFRRP